MMYNAVDVAKYIIWFCKENGHSISNLKLQKLLYFVQAQFLITTENLLSQKRLKHGISVQ